MLGYKSFFADIQQQRVCHAVMRMGRRGEGVSGWGTQVEGTDSKSCEMSLTLLTTKARECNGAADNLMYSVQYALIQEQNLMQRMCTQVLCVCSCTHYE